MANISKPMMIQAIKDACTSPLTSAEAAAALNAVTSTITMALNRGDTVQLHGFGGFKTERRDARVARNPKTGEKINVAAKRFVKFKPAADFFS